MMVAAAGWVVGVGPAGVDAACVEVAVAAAGGAAGELDFWVA
jgi:hypothetical protein